MGKFKTHKIPTYEIGDDSISGLKDVYVLNGFADTLYAFTPSSINPEVARYTSLYYGLYDDPFLHYNNFSQVQLGGGLLNGDQPESVYGLWQNIGQQYNGYSVNDNAQVGIAANGSADIGNHEIQFGIQYEQRSDAYYGYAPVGLWTLMRALTNAHIEQLDFSQPDPSEFRDTVDYPRLYDEASQYFFDYNLRKRLGMPANGLDWIDVDNYDPETFTIDMFSADELYRGGVNSLVSYFGYDYTGEKLTSRPAFDDFFNARDEYGNYTRAVGAYEPIYIAGYIQDKFAFNDLIFNVGVRVDRFDANQMVLKDPYLLYEARTVGEVDNLGSHPGNMGDDFIVYVNDVNNPTSITGYRNESTWYNADGKEITDPSGLDVGQGVSPYLVNTSEVLSSSAFKDYEPQTNLMPRISFSFPISDEALFFAHYDVLTQRPTDFERMDPTDYLFLEARTGYINNPSLKPSRTIDYELGFQQKLSNTSSLNFSTFYREMRDQIQAYRFSGAYPQSYYSYNNIDFGTVKG
ncbi:MAG: TonB-dependent receptor, partial [Bacteroidales bacterium]|nr:TonB-dependent receptor [Bacteroidales bacterium]